MNASSPAMHSTTNPMSQREGPGSNEPRKEGMMHGVRAPSAQMIGSHTEAVGILVGCPVGWPLGCTEG